MPLVETVVVGVGLSVAKSLLKQWGGDGLADEVLGAAVLEPTENSAKAWLKGRQATELQSVSKKVVDRGVAG